MKPLLDLDSPVERVHLPIFTRLFPMEHTFCQIRSIFVSLFPSFTPSSLRPDRRSKGHTSHFLLACSYLVAYPVGDLAAEVSVERGIARRLVSGETIHNALGQLGVRWKRAKQWITSPDPDYVRKKTVGAKKAGEGI